MSTAADAPDSPTSDTSRTAADSAVDDIGAGDGRDLRASRVVRLGAAVTGRDEHDLQSALSASRVVVTVDMDMPGAAETAQLLVATLARVPGTVTLVADVDGVGARAIAEIAAEYGGLRPESTLEVIDTFTDAISCPVSAESPAAPDNMPAHLHIGTTACHDPRCAATARSCVRVVPDGYGAHLVRTGPVSQARRPYSSGHMLAAAFAAGEAFIVAAGVDPDPGTLTPITTFCPVTLTDNLTLAPDLPADAHIDTALLGLGAVGTAAAAILSALPVTGRIMIADNQAFAVENIGTYTLGIAADAENGIHKVDVAARALSADVHKHYGDIAALPARIDAGELPWPAVVLSGVDTAAARHDVQALWADEHIDVGTGSTVVGLHHARPNGPCLRCFFPRRAGGPTPEQQLAATLGIDAALLGRDENWTAAEIAALPATADPRLATLAGKPKCATANLLGLIGLDGAEDYRPSVPFVSQQAACLLVGRLLAHVLAVPTSTNFFQYDTLTGPRWSNAEPREATAGCYCQQRAGIIEQVRARRATRK